MTTEQAQTNSRYMSDQLLKNAAKKNKNNRRIRSHDHGPAITFANARVSIDQDDWLDAVGLYLNYQSMAMTARKPSADLTEVYVTALFAIINSAKATFARSNTELYLDPKTITGLSLSLTSVNTSGRVWIRSEVDGVVLECTITLEHVRDLATGYEIAQSVR